MEEEEWKREGEKEEERKEATKYISFATLDASRRSSRVAASIIEKQVVVYRSWDE